METKCSAFWKHTNVRNDNKIFACCRYKTPVAQFTGNVNEILDLEVYKKLREDSINGVYNPNCQKCYLEESLGKKSLRETFNEEYSTDSVSLEFLEIGLDNICNLTCDACWGEFSSSWAKKNNEVIVIKSSKDIIVLPDSIRKILFLGGEPLMTKRHLKVLNKVKNKSEISIVYNTNGTFLLDSETIHNLKDFKKVKFILSIDGYGDLNEKVRSGSKWSDVVNFIDQIQKLDFELSINTTLHCNNWRGLKDLELFVKQKGVEWTVNFVTYPKELDLINVKEKVELKDILNSIKLIDLSHILKRL